MISFSTLLRFRPAAFGAASTAVVAAILLTAFSLRVPAQIPVGAHLAGEQRGSLNSTNNMQAAPLVNATVVLHVAANAGPAGTGPDGRLIGGPGRPPSQPRSRPSSKIRSTRSTG